MVDSIDAAEVEEALSAEVGEEVVTFVTTEGVPEPPALVVGLDFIDAARG